MTLLSESDNSSWLDLVGDRMEAGGRTEGELFGVNRTPNAVLVILESSHWHGSSRRTKQTSGTGPMTRRVRPSLWGKRCRPALDFHILRVNKGAEVTRARNYLRCTLQLSAPFMHCCHCCHHLSCNLEHTEVCGFSLLPEIRHSLIFASDHDIQQQRQSQFLHRGLSENRANQDRQYA